MAFLSPLRGSVGMGPGFPPLKRWARVGRPSGTGGNDVVSIRAAKRTQSCKTNPISGGRPRPPGRSAKRTQFPGPERPAAGAVGAEQSQFAGDGLGSGPVCHPALRMRPFVQTNPIRPGRAESQGTDVRNKADSRPLGRRIGVGIRDRVPGAPSFSDRPLRLDVVKPRRYLKWLVWSLWDARASGDSAGNGPVPWWSARKSNLIIPRS